MGYQLIETIEVGSGGAASIEFTGIPQDGVDLVLLVSSRGDGAGDNAGRIYFNSDTTDANYSEIWLYGNGSSVASYSFSIPYAGYANGTATTSNTFSNFEIRISNYASSASKSFSIDSVTENNGTNNVMTLVAGNWSGTNAITSISYQLGADDFVEYSTASLYKITAD